MIYYLILISLYTWPFGQLLAFYLPGLATNLYLLDIFVGLLTILIYVRKQTLQKVFADKLFRPIMLFNFAAIASLLINSSSLPPRILSIALVYLVRLFIYPSIYFSCRLIDAQKLLKPVFVSMAFFLLLGLLQYLLFPDMRYLKLLGFDDHYYRLIGSLFDPNFTGAILAAVALILIANNLWLYSLLPLTLLALTFSRASYLSFLIGVGYIVVRNKHLRFLLLMACLVLLIIVIPKPFGEGVNLFRTFSIYSRLDSWQAGLDLFLKKPFLGWGFNTLWNISGVRFQIDNSFLYVAATTGLVGLIAFLNLMKKTLTPLSFPKRIFVLTLLFHSLFNNSFFYIWINFAFWLILALPVRGYKPD